MDYSNKSKEELIEEINFLKKKEENISAVLNNINEIIFHLSFDENGNKKFEYISPHVDRVLGITTQKYIDANNANKILEYFHPDDVVKLQEESKKITPLQKEYSFTYRFFNKILDKYIWIEETIVATYDKKNDKKTAIFGTAKNVTDKVEREQQLSFILENINECIYNVKFTPKEKILSFVSPHISKLLGLTIKEFHEEGKEGGLLKRVHPDDVDVIMKTHEDLYEKNKKQVKNIFRFKPKKSKKYIWLEETLYATYDKKGELIETTTVLRDVTYKKIAEIHLKENEEKYRTIFTKNLAGVFITKNDIIIDCNNSFAKIFGYKTRVELIGKSVLDLYIDIKDREEYIKELKEKKFLINYKIRHKNKKGEEIWILTNVYLKKDGKIEGTLVDITEQIKIEKQLKENTNNYKNLIDNSPYATLIHVDGEIVYANKKSFEFLGFENFEQLNGKLNLFDYLPKEYQTDAIIRRNKVMKGEKIPFIELKIKKPLTGEIIDIETRSTAFNYKGEKAIHLVFQDVSDSKKLSKEKLRATIAEESNQILQKEIKERKKVEKQLKENQKYLNSIINSSLDIICASDTKGKVIEFNDAAELAFGYSYSEISNTNVNKIYASSDDYIKVSKALKEKGIFVGEIENKRKNGSIFTSFLSASVLYNEEGEKIGTMGVSRDITELKEAENQLIDSLKEKEVLLKEVHHRVKNNLQVISSILNLQSSYVKDENTLNILKESQNRIKSMSFIHESLYQTNDFSSINFSEYIVSLSKNLVHSYGLYDDLIELDFIIDEVQLNLDASIPCGLIVNELVSNALKYAFKDNKAGTITIELFVKNENVHLIIRDNGVGLSEKIDFRNTETLGLQLVTSLIEQIEGNIELKVNKGTEYTIIFKQN